MRIGLSSAQDFLALLVRRKWWIITPFIAISSASAILISFLPGVFVSEALILVQPRDVPEKFVIDLISGSTQDRLSTIEQTLRSRTNLLQILREFEDRLPEFRPLDMDAKVERLNSQIQIRFEEGGGPRQALTSFRMSYQNQNPALAQQIASKLTTLFIEQDHRIIESQVFGTTEFLSSELEKVSEQLNASDKELAELKSSKQFEPPGQLETNLRTLDRLTLQRQTNLEALDRNATVRLSLERQIAETPEVIRQMSSVPAGSPDPRLEEYRRAESEYEEAAAVFTSKHPQVLAAKARLDRLKTQLPTVPSGPSTQSSVKATSIVDPMGPNPVYEKLAAQLQQVKTDADALQKEKNYIESEIEKLNRRVENTPRSEERLAEGQRRNASLQKQSDDLKAKLAEAELAQSLEGRQKGSQFVVVDPANYPLRPTKPNKLSVLMASTIASLAIAIVFAVAVNVARQQVWTQTEIEALWGTPILAEIPEILIDSDLAVQKKRKFYLTASFVATTGAYAVCLYLIYLKHNFILQRLDPVIQKLVYK